MNGLGWLSEYSEPALRSALRMAGAGLERLPIALTGTNDLDRPTWATGSATIDRRLLAKFAFSAPTAERIWHEARVPELLALARERLGDALRTPEPGLQATTAELRSRFTGMIPAGHRARVRRWCDWVDEQLAAPAEVVFAGVVASSHSAAYAPQR